MTAFAALRFVKKYGLTLLTTADDRLEAYIRKVMEQVQSTASLSPGPGA